MFCVNHLKPAPSQLNLLNLAQTLEIPICPNFYFYFFALLVHASYNIFHGTVFCTYKLGVKFPFFFFFFFFECQNG